MPAADGQLVGVAEVVLRAPAELGAGQVEHLELPDLLVLEDHVVERLRPLRGSVARREEVAVVGVHRFLLAHRGRLVEVERVGNARDLDLLKGLEVQQVEGQLERGQHQDLEDRLLLALAVLGSRGEGLLCSLGREVIGVLVGRAVASVGGLMRGIVFLHGLADGLPHGAAHGFHH